FRRPSLSRPPSLICALSLHYALPISSSFSASAAALSGNDASKSINSLPASWPSSQAVHFSSNVFINVLQQSLEFLAGIKQARHDRANRAAQRLGNFVILHLFDLFH